MAPNRKTFQPVITASTWETAWRATAKAAHARNGSGTATDGVVTPRLTNGDAATLVKAWSERESSKFFPLWYQYAAAAYAWDPVGPHGGMAFDELNTTEKQRASMLDIELARELWSNLALVAKNYDDHPITGGTRLALDDNAFADPVFIAGVRAALKGDGAMRAQFKIPIGCKGKDGKLTGPKLKCREGWELEQVKGTVIPMYVCRNKTTGETEQPTYGCEDETVFVDDPITGFKKIITREAITIALILGFAWLVVKDGADN